MCGFNAAAGFFGCCGFAPGDVGAYLRNFGHTRTVLKAVACDKTNE
jgi:hypothetical protein